MRLNKKVKILPLFSLRIVIMTTTVYFKNTVKGLKSNFPKKKKMLIKWKLIIVDDNEN